MGRNNDETNAHDARKVLDEALAVCRSGEQSALVNVLIGKTDFREGSISV
ncbi:hypothetical protein CRE_22262 [Caenorhabditis remanei]|uniref:Uncharacterized protein n=1 Tax=Caenorhabditis remanei TaxID=31234 RepID=E3NV95_CAERE|nr:hypothetical protein CRE_22262 [Caenorhabditis remanei]